MERSSRSKRWPRCPSLAQPNKTSRYACLTLGGDVGLLDSWMFPSGLGLRVVLPLLLIAAGPAMTAASGASSARPAAPALAAAAVPASAPQRRLEPIVVPPVTATAAATALLAGGPGQAGLAGLGAELARAFIGVLRDANLDARATLSKDSAATAESTLTAHLDAVGGDRLRLSASWRGSAVSAVGDLEHLDDLVYAVFEQLRPRLLAEVAPAGVPPPEPPSAPAAPVATAPPASPTPPRKHGPAHPLTPAKPSEPPVVVPISTTPPGTPARPKPPEKSPDKPVEKPPEKLPEKPVETIPPPTPTPEVRPAVRQRVAVAVHVVGDPFGAVPPIFYSSGVGALGQQFLVHYLQTRLRINAIPSRLVGLVGGLEALTQSLRLGARHTLMVRFDTLTDSPAPGTTAYNAAYGARTLSGRLHVVLLLDSRPLLDRSLALPATPYYPQEAPSTVLSRVLSTAMDSIATDLSTRLPPQAPAGVP